MCRKEVGELNGYAVEVLLHDDEVGIEAITWAKPGKTEGTFVGFLVTKKRDGTSRSRSGTFWKRRGLAPTLPHR